MHNNHAPRSNEKGVRLPRLSLEQVQAISARAQVRWYAAQLLLQAAYMEYPGIFAQPEPAPQQAAPAQTENPLANVVSMDAYRQQGETIADRHLAEVVSLQEERDRRAAAAALEGRPVDMMAPDNNPDHADAARMRVVQALGLTAEGDPSVQEAA